MNIIRTAVRPVLVYGAETWSTTKTEEKRLEVNEMRMMRWICGVTKKDKIRNEHVRRSAKVEPVTNKITQKRLKWYGHVLRGFAKLKKLKKNPKQIGSGFHLDKKKLENRPKIKCCVCTIRPCLAVHVAPCDMHACSILSRIL